MQVLATQVYRRRKKKLDQQLLALFLFLIEEKLPRCTTTFRALGSLGSQPGGVEMTLVQ